MKLGLFATVFALEIVPMLTFIAWRRARAGGAAPWTTAPIGRLVRLNDAELALVVLIPFAAALMARGVWLFDPARRRARVQSRRMPSRTVNGSACQRAVDT